MKTGILLEHELKRTISQRANVDEYKICHRSSGTSTRHRPPWLEGCVKTDILIEPQKTGTLNENNFTLTVCQTWIILPSLSGTYIKFQLFCLLFVYVTCDHKTSRSIAILPNFKV